MTIAQAVSQRATCDRAHVGAVLVCQHIILSTGYNGAPRGLADCDHVGHILEHGHCVRSVHAEINAIIQAAYVGRATDGAVLYVTHFPCLSCTKALINAGIQRIVYREGYRIHPLATEMLEQSGINIKECDV
jgi:dCMP deaminase